MHKSWNTLQLWDQICPISGPDLQFSNIIFKINRLDLLWVLNFIALGIYFTFGTKFFGNEGIDTWFNVDCLLLGRNFDFFGGYLVVTARYLVVTALYLVVTGGYSSWLVVTARYHSLLLVSTFSMNADKPVLSKKKEFYKEFWKLLGQFVKTRSMQEGLSGFLKHVDLFIILVRLKLE